jgi:hypothetical protein
MRIVKLALGGMFLLSVMLGAGRAPQRLSPHESVSASIDGSEITITYGRPYMRGRLIFGGLVPYGRIWCPGADEATTLDSGRELLLGQSAATGLRVPPGPHTIWVLPTEDVWTLIVSKEPSGFHTNYNPRADLGRIEMRKRALDTPVEQLTFAILKNATTAGGVIAMSWERTEVIVPFAVVQ